MTTQTVDARRLLCPLPVIRVQRVVDTLAPSTRVQVLCTDPGASHDIPAWCRMHGHTVEGIERRGEEIRIGIVVGTALPASGHNS